MTEQRIDNIHGAMAQETFAILTEARTRAVEQMMTASMQGRHLFIPAARMALTGLEMQIRTMRAMQDIGASMVQAGLHAMQPAEKDD